jgi:phosphatidylinositol-3,4,5-trisphosphate 3-phosphatase/dual-specificity protein phosphatase PTEN
MYRNPMPEVQRFFSTRHEGHYKIYNLCSERSYDKTAFFEAVGVFPFDDHNPSALELLKPFCEDAAAFLSEHKDNVIAVHCKAGKGRTGMMISTLLLHTGVCATADEALQKFSEERTKNNKGVTIPSQMRFVHYYEQTMRRQACPVFTYHITHIRLITVPEFDPSITGGGCDPYFRCQVMQKKDHLQWKPRTIYDYKKTVKKVKHYNSSDSRFADLDCSSHNLKVRGDVKMIFYDEDQYSKDDKMFHLWFNTAFIENNYLCFEKSVIDKACKDKHNKLFDASFRVEIFLHKVEDGELDYQHLGDEEEDLDTDDDDDE